MKASLKSKNMKKCLSCKKDISHLHHRSKRCKPCAKTYKKEYFRAYMAKYTLKKKQEKYDARSEEDTLLLANNYMTGTGTFDMAEFDGDFEEEYKRIQGLKRRFFGKP